MIESFEPLTGENPEILILGSMPGAESLKRQMYYAYRHNRLWKILFRYFNVPYSDSDEEKRALVRNNGIALYDVFRSCDRENSSLDSHIKNEIPNDIDGLLKSRPTIKAVLINGQRAGSGYEKYFSHINIPVEKLPSTSPANAAFGNDRLYDIWKEALDKYLK